METKHQIPQENNKVKASINGQIIFGGSGGSFKPINNIGGKSITFKGGDYLDSIQIGNEIYGGTGGSESGTAILPQDGSMTLLKLQANESFYINYIEANVNGVDIKVGKENTSATSLEVNMQVIISGINSGKYVDSLQFNMVQK